MTIEYYGDSPMDRREKSRFDIRRNMRYKLRHGAKEIGSGCGCTLDMSSNGAAFTTEGYIEPGTAIEMSISWPVLLEGRSALRLVAHGVVVRSTILTAACRISRFEFRMQGKAAAATEVRAAAA